MAKDDRFRGPVGKDGANGTVDAMHLAAVTESILQTIRADERFRGPAGPVGPRGEQGLAGESTALDVDALTQQILAQLPGQRVVLKDGKSGKIIDDETYKPGEAIVLDFQQIIRSQAANTR
jgi:hypothetical protein